VNPPPNPGSPGPLPPAPRPNPFEPPPVGSYAGYSGPARYAPPTSSDALGALVCGILSWGCFPLGFLAIWLGARARRTIRESQGQTGGDQAALAGMILGGIFVGLHVLIFFGYLALFGFGIAFGAFHK
jgi:Domain of unknown function (DUF4190)